MRYRVVESKGERYKIEYQENGGGTLTTSATIEFDIEQRNIRRDGKPTTIRVVRVASYSQNWTSSAPDVAHRHSDPFVLIQKTVIAISRKE